MTGIIIVDKPSGWTSQDVVAKLRGILREKRIGHGGTLDPMATGVLPVFVGRATRAVPFFEHADKEYIAAIKLGITTDTQDTTGTTLSSSHADVSRDELEAVLTMFRGEIEQLPPMYSAVKVNGERLYAIARRGGEVERKARKIIVSEAEILSGSGDEYTIRFVVSKGTYIRTLCHDIGASLNVGGAMSALRRTRAGEYDIARAVTLGEIENARDNAALDTVLLPLQSMFASHPSVIVTPAQEKYIRDGREIISEQFPESEFCAIGESGEFLALMRGENGAAQTIKSFFEVRK